MISSRGAAATGAPFGPSFWIKLSGICFVLAGIAILSGVLKNVAARLFAVMLLVFEVALVPIAVRFPHMHPAWGTNAYNLAVAGAVWIYAASLRESARQALEREPTHTSAAVAV